MRIPIMVAFLILILPRLAGGQGAAPPCAAPEARQFDFWVGEWDLSWLAGDGSTTRGTNVITRMWDDCGIEENFSGSFGGAPYLGHSVSMWHPASGKWRQTWVDSQGGYLVFTGGREEGGMVLHGVGAPQADGSPTRTRMSFLNIEPDGFDWHWERSIDDGATWQMVWKIRYDRKS